jgi:hypothetical protein
VLDADVLADDLQDLAVDLELVEIDGRQAILVRQEVGDLFVVDEAEARERIPEILSGLLLLWRSCCRLMSFSRTRSSPSRFVAMGRVGSARQESPAGWASSL